MVYCTAISLVGLGLIFSDVQAHLKLPLDIHNWSRNQDQCGRAHLDGVEFLSRRSCLIPKDERNTTEPNKWAPWTHRPYCADSKYCVFTNAKFYRNQGISIITTPERLANNTGLLDILFSDPTIREADPPPYEVKELPGKGFGVIATRLIKRDEIIMAEAANILADFNIPLVLEHRKGVELFNRAFYQMPDTNKLFGLATSNQHLLAPISEDVMKTNSFKLPLSYVDRMVLFPKIARMNHACDPNASTRWSEKTLENAAVATRDIEPGEEINISYAQFGLTYAERQETLQDRWGFKCTCSMCTAPEEVREKSDMRREKIRELRDKVQEMIDKSHYHKAIKLQRQLLSLAIKERLEPHYGEYYWVLARLYLAVRDKDNTIKYSRIAVKQLKKYQKGGNEMDDTIADLELFLASVKNHN